jgi:hypothetical protein
MLARVEASKPSERLRKGLRELTTVLLEVTIDFAGPRLAEFDAALGAAGAPTLSAMRERMWRVREKVMARGRIRSREEYDLINERLNDVSESGFHGGERERGGNGGRLRERAGAQISASNAQQRQGRPHMRMLLIAVVLSLTVAPAAAQVGCPGNAARARGIVARVAFSEEYSPSRKRLGLPTAAGTEVRVLTDSADADACKRLNEMLASRAPIPDWRDHWVPVFYKAGAYYYAVLSPMPDDTPAPPGMVKIDLRWTPLFVVKPDFTVLAIMAV